MRGLPTNQPGFFGEGTVAIADAATGEGAPRRSAISPDALVTRPAEGVDTVYDLLLYAARTHGTGNALGLREVLDVIEEEKEVVKVVDGKEVVETKKWKYFHLGEYKYHTFVQLKQVVQEVAGALYYELGVVKGAVWNIYAQTCPNWQIMSHACASISVTVATAYDTLGETGLTHSLNEPGCVGIFTNAELLPIVLKVLPKTSTVKYVVYDGAPTEDILSQLHSARPEGIRVFSIDQLRELGKGKPEKPLEKRRPTPDAPVCIMYTSGSTGNPKGVVIKHSNIVAAVGGAVNMVEHHLGPDDAFLAFLPLAHIFEYMIELVMLFLGVTTGYGRVKTLTDASVRNCQGDIAEFRPTFMIGVPAVWEAMRKGILTKVNAGGPVKKALFHGSLWAKKYEVPVLAQLADAVVLKGVRAAVGGRLKWAINGGAALCTDTQEFFNLAVMMLVQGYGLTESTGACLVVPPEHMPCYGSIGWSSPSIEIKLIDVPEAGYLSSNPIPQGELCLRGAQVITEYYKRPDLNGDETIFTKDGWFRTGDIGQLNEDGTLNLIDRLKNLVKLQTGEYIALERLESAYKSCNLVNNLCVLATPDAAQPVGIIIPHEAHLRHKLSEIDDIDASASLSTLCELEDVKELILRECNAIGRKNGFKGAETLQAVILTPDEWTPESGMLTPAQKIQRSKIGKVFEKQIKEAYGQPK